MSVSEGQISNIPELVQIMAWRRPGDKPLSEPWLLDYWPVYASLGLNELNEFELMKIASFSKCLDSHYKPTFIPLHQGLILGLRPAIMLTMTSLYMYYHVESLYEMEMVSNWLLKPIACVGGMQRCHGCQIDVITHPGSEANKVDVRRRVVPLHRKLF